MQLVKRPSAIGFALAFLFALDARAQSTRSAAEESLFRPVSHDRRYGVVLGVSGGGALAGSSGNPSDPKLENDPSFYASSPLLGGWSTSYFLLGALSDYVSVGPTVTIATFESSQWKSTGFGVGLRAELFPFVAAVPALADLALYGQAGIGSTELRAKGPYPSAGNTASFLGLGLHHEWRLARLLGGHAAAGPYFEYDVIPTPTVERHWASVGLRVVWYGGSVKLDESGR